MVDHVRGFNNLSAEMQHCTHEEVCGTASQCLDSESGVVKKVHLL